METKPMKKTGIAVVVASIVLVGAFVLEARATSVSACYPADGYARSQLHFLRQIAVAPSGMDSAYRADAQLPLLSDTMLVYQVSDSATCAAALGPHNQHAQYTPGELTSSAAQRLYLFRYREFWIASNPLIHEETDFVAQYVMDSTFNFVQSYPR
jgi:hypothetical protein